MDANPDFRDLLQCFCAEKVRFIVVGAYAVIFHAEPRFTKDLDVWVDPTAANAKRTWRALTAFGAPLAGVTVDDFATPDTYYLIGVPPNRIDVITSIDGVPFASAWRRRVKSRYADVPVAFLSIPDLLVNKRTVGRPQDLADIRRLEAAQRRGRPSRS